MKKASANENAGVKSAQSMNVGIPLSGLPVIGDSPLGGAKITLGYENMDAMADTYQAKEGGTVAVVMPLGPLSVGFQKKAYAPVATADGTKTFYKDDVIGIAYAVNDDFAISYNLYESASTQ